LCSNSSEGSTRVTSTLKWNALDTSTLDKSALHACVIISAHTRFKRMLTSMLFRALACTLWAILKIYRVMESLHACKCQFKIELYRTFILCRISKPKSITMGSTTFIMRPSALHPSTKKILTYCHFILILFYFYTSCDCTPWYFQKWSVNILSPPNNLHVWSSILAKLVSPLLQCISYQKPKIKIVCKMYRRFTWCIKRCYNS